MNKEIKNIMDQPKKEHVHEHPHKHHKHPHKHHKHKKKMDLWKVSSIAFLLLLIISVFSNGFSDFTGMSIMSDKLELTVISDKECLDCSAGQTEILGIFTEMFTELDIKELDYEDNDAQTLIKEYNLELLPAYIFNENIKEQEEWKSNVNLQSAFKEIEGNFVAIEDAVGAEHNPLKEICDNEKDDRDQDGKIDCEDDECKFELACNKDALVECSEQYGAKEDTIIFYYANTCGWCSKMKPGVTQLQEEGYDFKWVDSANAEESQVINECFRKYMTGGGVPQFICVKNGNIKSGAFVDADKNLDVSLMQSWADACLAS